MVANIRRVKDCGMRTNGGSFVLWREIFDWIGEELVQPYDGFLACMDTFKYKQLLRTCTSLARCAG